ncbi:hypothetical protein DFH11DRAFT_1728740 [Phellopilus nigrolimitatus]|nr:hypothetical protein DFH11DRAFT_1728740 [Phellopilus nigrolimitatus]
MTRARELRSSSDSIALRRSAGGWFWADPAEEWEAAVIEETGVAGAELLVFGGGPGGRLGVVEIAEKRVERFVRGPGGDGMPRRALDRLALARGAPLVDLVVHVPRSHLSRSARCSGVSSAVSAIAVGGSSMSRWSPEEEITVHTAVGKTRFIGPHTLLTPILPRTSPSTRRSPMSTSAGHALSFLATRWSTAALAFITCRPASDLRAADAVHIVPAEHRGKGEIVHLRKKDPVDPLTYIFSYTYVLLSENPPVSAPLPYLSSARPPLAELQLTSGRAALGLTTSDI